VLPSDPTNATDSGANDGASGTTIIERAILRGRAAAAERELQVAAVRQLPSNVTSATDSGTDNRPLSTAIIERTGLVPSGTRRGEQLFRKQVLTERQTQWMGTVLLAPRRSDRWFTLGAVLTMLAILGLLFFGEFTRKARVGGWLVPQQGLMRVFAPQPGVVAQLYVKEGAQVRKGERLLRLSGELESATLGATQAEIVRRLIELRDALRDERRQQERLLTQQQRTYANRLSALHSEVNQVEHDIGTMKARVALAERNAKANRSLRDQGFISEQQLQLVEADRLEQHSRLGALERQQIELGREQVTLQGELNDLPVKTRAELATIERNMATAEQELAQAEARREIVVPAPQDGTVTAILIEEGGHANISAPLLSIVPAGANLEAHLYSPSRAVGFVRPGQHVLVRYQAYPYQKFGHYEGVVASISRSAVNPTELPPQLAGVIRGVTEPEPVYRITVGLARQTVTTYGRQVDLQPGMQLEADIALETRRLYEWVLDPLYTVTGKWHR
jgi:membrane fusion protein